MRQKAIETSEIIVHRERSYPKFTCDARVGLVRDSATDPMICRTNRLSWEGASLLMPGKGLYVNDPVRLRFPWGRRDSFSAHAQVLKSRHVDDTHSLVGVVFTKLRVRDEEKLKQVLSMLSRAHKASGEAGVHLRHPAGSMLSRAHKASAEDTSIADGLELRLLDRREMLAALGQIGLGLMETTVFQPIQTNERVPLVLTGLGDLPTLHLRSRILSHKALRPTASPQEPGMSQVAMTFDHPHEDLKQITAPMIARLNRSTDAASVAGARATRNTRCRKRSCEQMSAAGS